MSFKQHMKSTTHLLYQSLNHSAAQYLNKCLHKSKLEEVTWFKIS